MRIGLLADVHSNAVCLDRAIGLLRGRVDRLLLAGDAISAHRFSRDVIELIRASDIGYIGGNHERDWLSPQGERARRGVAAEDVAFIAAAPPRMELSAGRRRVLMVHGSPWPPYDEYLYEWSPLIGKMPELGADFVFLGHTHQPMVVQAGRTLVVNPGSAGDPRGPGTGGMATYAIVDTDARQACIEKFPWVPSR